MFPMKSMVLLLFACIILFGCEDKDNMSFKDWNSHDLVLANRNSLLQYDGMYVEKNDSLKLLEDEYRDLEYFNNYLRFYPNNDVISVCSNGDPYQLRAWFNRDHENCSKGICKLNGQHIEFVCTNKNGNVFYEGNINEKGVLELNIWTIDTGYRSKRLYEFIRMSYFNR